MLNLHAWLRAVDASFKSKREETMTDDIPAPRPLVALTGNLAVDPAEVVAIEFDPIETKPAGAAKQGIRVVLRDGRETYGETATRAEAEAAVLRLGKVPGGEPIRAQKPPCSLASGETNGPTFSVERPRLMTPEERAKWEYGDQAAVSHTGVISLTHAVRADRADIWQKACLLPRYIAKQSDQSGATKRGDWNCIALDDLAALLEGR